MAVDCSDPVRLFRQDFETAFLEAVVQQFHMVYANSLSLMQGEIEEFKSSRRRWRPPANSLKRLSRGQSILKSVATPRGPEVHEARDTGVRGTAASGGEGGT